MKIESRLDGFAITLEKGERLIIYPDDGKELEIQNYKECAEITVNNKHGISSS